MKVPAVSGDNSLNDMTVYRKKKKRFKIIRNLIILAVIAAIAAVVFIFRDDIAQSLRGIATRFGSGAAQGQGFPMKLPGSSQYKLLPVGNDFALVTDTYLYIYNSSGGENVSFQHGYVDPSASADANRVLIYDRGGHDFALYSPTAQMYKLSVSDEVIVSAYQKGADRTAVVTSGGRYSNTVYVYDGNGKWLYTRKFIDENVMQADFSDDGKYMYLTLVRSDNGDIKTDICKYDISSEDAEIWKCTISDGIPLGFEVNGSTVTAVEDNAIYSVNAEDGSQIGRYSYNGELLDFDIGSDANVLVMDYYTGGGKTVKVLDKSCAETAGADGYDSIAEMMISDSEICILSGRDIIRTDLSLKTLGQAHLEHDFTEFIKAGPLYLMLGYDTIEKANL